MMLRRVLCLENEDTFPYIVINDQRNHSHILGCPFMRNTEPHTHADKTLHISTVLLQPAPPGRGRVDSR